MEISKELVEELGNKVKKLEDRRGKFNTVFYAVAGEQLGSCKKLNLPIISDMNLSGDSAEKTFCFTFDTYVLLSGDGGKVTNPNSVDVGNLLGLGSVSLCGVEEALQTLFGDVEIESETFKISEEDLKKSSQEEKAEHEDEDEVEKVELTGSSAKFESFIGNKVDELMTTYEALYKPCYETSRPKGVLTPEGIYTLNGTLMSVDNRSKAELSTVYSVIESCLGKLDGVSRFNSKVSPKTLDQTDGKPLYINYHLANMYGYFGNRSKKSTSFREFSSYIRERTERILTKIVSNIPEETRENNPEEVERVILQYLANLKNCILVEDYKAGVVLKLRISIDTAMYPNEFSALNEEAFKGVISKGYLFKTSTTVSSPSRDNGVIYLNFVVDAQSYYNAPLFAYEALPMLQDQGTKLSWSNVLIGKNIKDEYVFSDFSAEQKKVYNIMAGSGSGKGVMTLSLLASALASNVPVMYGDCKPDMSKVLWDTTEGENVLAIDGYKGGTLDALEGKYNIYSYYNECVPDPLKEYLKGKGLEKSFVKTHGYVKLMELAYLITCDRARKEQNHLLKSDDYILFIFDEIGMVSDQVSELVEALCGANDGDGGFVAEYKAKLKADGAKSNEIALDPVIQYTKDYVKYFSTVIGAIKNAETAQMRQAHAKFLFIWQPSWLKDAAVGSITKSTHKHYFLSRVCNLVSMSSTIKFAGKQSETSGVLGMGPVYNDETRELFDEYRYFAMSESGDFSGDDVQIFRPFLLLNDASESSAAKCVSTNPLAREKVYVNGRDGAVVPEVGFPAYVQKILGGNVKEPLCKSWGIAENSLRDFGYEPNVLDFLYNVSDFRVPLDNNEGNSELDSTNGKGTKVKKKSYSEMLRESESNVDGDSYDEDEESIKEDEDERFKEVFSDLDEVPKSVEIADDDQIDMYGDSMLVESNIIDRSQEISDEEFHSNVREAEEILKRLQELGVDVTLNNNEVLQTNVKGAENRSTLDLGEGYTYSSYRQTYEDLLSLVTKDIINEFGGLDRFNRFILNGGSIGVNRTYYRCKISKRSAENIPYDIRRQIDSGCIFGLFDYRLLWKMPNLREITVDSMSTFRDYIKPLYKGDIEAIFGTIKTLETLTIGTDVIERSNLDASVLNKKLFDSERNESIGSTIQGVLFKGTAKSASLMKNSFTSNKKWYLKALGVTTGGVGVIATGSMGVATGITRGIASGIKGFGNGLKELFK